MSYKVIVDTLEMVDVAAGHDKFYRVYRIPMLDLAYCQNGSQRSGRSGGTFRAYDHDQGLSKINEKRRKGYQPVGQTVEFGIDQQKFTQQQAKGDKIAGPWLEAQFAAADRKNKFTGAPASSQVTAPKAPTSSQPKVPVPTSVVSSGLLVQLSDQLLDAISVAAEDPSAALVAYAELGEKFEELDLEVRKLKSYRDTLTTLVEDAL